MRQLLSTETIESMRGRLHHVILDCPDPRALARFYSALLNHPITYASDEFVVVAANDTTSGLAFQLAPDHRAPTWPDTAVPQQMHLDIMVRECRPRDASRAWSRRDQAQRRRRVC